jgi:hypothetical protein
MNSSLLLVFRFNCVSVLVCVKLFCSFSFILNDWFAPNKALILLAIKISQNFQREQSNIRFVITIRTQKVYWLASDNNSASVYCSGWIILVIKTLSLITHDDFHPEVWEQRVFKLLCGNARWRLHIWLTAFQPFHVAANVDWLYQNWIQAFERYLRHRKLHVWSPFIGVTVKVSTFYWRKYILIGTFCMLGNFDFFKHFWVIVTYLNDTVRLVTGFFLVSNSQFFFEVVPQNHRFSASWHPFLLDNKSSKVTN